MSEVKNNADNACGNGSQIESSTASLTGDRKGQSSFGKRNFSEEEIKIAQKVYSDIYPKCISKGLDPNIKFREEQIAQAYFSILKKGEEHIRSPKAWRDALELETDDLMSH